MYRVESLCLAASDMTLTTCVSALPHLGETLWGSLSITGPRGGSRCDFDRQKMCDVIHTQSRRSDSIVQ